MNHAFGSILGRASTCGLLALLFSAWSPGPASAHPHVWIDAEIDVILQGKAISELAQQWTFDPFFSSLMIEDFDKDKNGTLDEAETKTLRQGAFDNLKNFDYFTHFIIGKTRTGAAEVRKFSATIEGENLIYRFRTPLPRTVDSSRAPFVFSIHDSSFYVNVRIPGEWVVRFQGDNSGHCASTLKDDVQRPLYLGAFYPTNIEVRCGQK